LRFDTVNRIALLLGDLKGIVSEEEIVATPTPCRAQENNWPSGG